MIPLDIFTPTRTRFFTFYDRCAIELDAIEMRAVRVRVSVTIIASPLSRTLNFKWPLSKEFFGYAQAFYLGSIYQEFPINYTVPVIWDYWNQHATMAHQLTSVLQRLSEYLKVSVDFQEFVLPSGDSGDGNDLNAIRESVKRLTEGLTLEAGGGANDNQSENDYVNTFNHPWNLLRLKFTEGTVFNVAIDSWSPGNTYGGSLGGNPTTEVPYDTANPNGTAVPKTPGTANPEAPYGPNPPESSPLDPDLDPGDFSNAPEPGIGGEGFCLRVFGDVQIINLDGAPRAIDITYGPYPEGFDAYWEVGSQTVTPPIRDLYQLTVVDGIGTLVDIPITADLLGSASLERVSCPP